MTSLLVAGTLATLRRSSDHPLRACEHLCASRGEGSKFVCIHHALARGVLCLRCASAHLVAGHRLRLDAPSQGQCDSCGQRGTVEIGSASMPVAGLVVQCPDGRLAELAGALELYGYTTCYRCRADPPGRAALSEPERNRLLTRLVNLTGVDVVDVELVTGAGWGRRWRLVLADGTRVTLGTDHQVADWRQLQSVLRDRSPSRYRLVRRVDARRLLATLVALRRTP